MRVRRQRHRRRVPGLTRDLDDRHALPDEQRAEGMAQVIRTHSGYAVGVRERIEDAPSPVPPVVIAPQFSIARGEDERLVDERAAGKSPCRSQPACPPRRTCPARASSAGERSGAARRRPSARAPQRSGPAGDGAAAVGAHRDGVPRSAPRHRRGGASLRRTIARIRAGPLCAAPPIGEDVSTRNLAWSDTSRTA